MKYRIIEKKGTWGQVGVCTTPHHCREYKYIPRFIVQKLQSIHPACNLVTMVEKGAIKVGLEYMFAKDLKEFTSLAEAEKYVEDILLEEGIIRGEY